MKCNVFMEEIVINLYLQIIKINEMFTCVPTRQHQRTHGYGSTVMEVQRPALSPVMFRVTVLQEKNRKHETEVHNVSSRGKTK